MNRGLILKSLRELAPVTAIMGAVAMLVAGIVTFVLARFQDQFSAQLLQLPFIRSMIAAMVGAENPAGELGVEMFAGIPWVHPVVLAFVLGHAVVCCTRIPAGEVDRGTIDVLLGMPVSRWRVYISDTIVWTLAATVIVGLVLSGNLAASLLIDPAKRQDPAHSAIVAASLLALVLAIGAFSFLCSAISSRKGRAMGAAAGFILAAFLLNYLSQLWQPARDIEFLSLFAYHKPLEILRTGAWPWKNLGVLLGIAAIFWGIGGAIFARRDLSTL